MYKLNQQMMEKKFKVQVAIFGADKIDKLEERVNLGLNHMNPEHILDIKSNSIVDSSDSQGFFSTTIVYKEFDV